MRDSRFDSPHSMTRRRHHLIEQGRRVEAEAWFADAVSALAAWCTEQVRRIQSNSGVAEQAVILPSENTTSALSSVENMPTDRARSLAGWVPYDSYITDDPESDWIWGAALANSAAVLVSNFDGIAYTWRTAGHRDAAREAYLTGLAAVLDGTGQVAMFDLMRQIVERIRTLQGCYAFSNRRELFGRVLADWWDDAHLSNVWSIRNLEELAVDCDEAWLLDAVRRHDRMLYLDLLDDTRNPVVVKQILSMPDVMEDIDEVLNLLAVAPLVRSGIMPDKPIGEWNRRIVAASLLETVNAHARTLVGLLLQDHPVTPASPDDIARLAQDLLDRFNRTASVALGREDGRGLTSEWMLYLAREIAHASWAVTLVPERIALHAVAQRLVAQGMTEETLQRMIIPLREGVPGVDVLLALSIVSYERDQGVIANLPETERAPAVAPGNTLLLNMFTELLNHGDPDLSYHRNASPPSWSHAFMGLLFVRTIDPRRAWQAAWIRLAEQRRKMYHIRYGQDSPVDEPSLFVLYAGIAAVQWLQAAQEEASGAAALQVWDCMYDAGGRFLTHDDEVG